MARVSLGVTQSYVHPHTNHTCLYSPATKYHRNSAGTHCACPRRDGQAELTSHTHCANIRYTQACWLTAMHRVITRSRETARRLPNSVESKDLLTQLKWLKVSHLECGLRQQETRHEMRYPNVASLYFNTPLAISVNVYVEVKGCLR